MMAKGEQSLIKAKQKASQLLQSNRLADAWSAFEAISRQAPGYYEVWLNMGAIAAMQGQFERAESSLRRALTLKSDLPQGNINMARLLMMRGRSEEALPYLQNYVKLQPNVQEGHYQLGALLDSLGNAVAAEHSFRDALALGENNPVVLVALARVLRSNGKHEEARDRCLQALQLQPNAVAAYLELGNIVRELRDFDEALRCYQRVIELDPNQRESHLMGMAQTYTDLLRFDEALNCYEALLRTNPNSVSGHWNYALLLLLLGRYKEGWDEYEWRWQTPLWQRQPWGKFDKPLWNGEPLTNRTILVYAEQGLGDAIQFVRYLQPLIAQAGQVVFHCPKELMGLFKRISGLQVEVRDYNMARQQSFDFHLPLVSLARIMGTTVETIPADVPYLQTDSERVDLWSRRIKHEGFKVGLVWGGAVNNPSNRIRSVALELLAPLINISGVVFYSLQKGVESESKRVVEEWNIIDLAPELNDFEDTVAAIENLDLVITVDTAVAHLAGALGRPVWTLIYQPTEWRWLLWRDDSPWYPTMRLFRQSFEEPCWPPVIERVAEALRQVVEQKRG